MRQPSLLPDAAVELSPLASRVADAVAARRGGRVSVEALREAAFAADLSLAGSPDSRTRLADVVTELAGIGLVTLPKGAASWDRTVLPHLPLWVAKPVEVRMPARSAPNQLTWHAALGWAASGRWKPEELRLLRAVNDWLVGGGPLRKVPLQERSLQLTGDEKTLGMILRGPLFVPGRLSLEMLGSFRASPPFVYTKTGGGPCALVVENSATFRTIADGVRGKGTPIGLVAFGGGNGFVRSIEYFTELSESERLDGPIREIRYFGDLDTEGLRIPASASRTAVDLGLPPILPAVGLYRRLFARGRPGPSEPVDPATATSLVAWLPAELREQASAHLRRGERLAQEAVGRDLLADDATWATIEELGCELGFDGQSGSGLP